MIWRQCFGFEQYDTLDRYFDAIISNRASGSKRLYHFESLIQLCARSYNGSILCQYRTIWSLTTRRFTIHFAHLHDQSILSRKQNPISFLMIYPQTSKIYDDKEQASPSGVTRSLDKQICCKSLNVIVGIRFVFEGRTL